MLSSLFFVMVSSWNTTPDPSVTLDDIVWVVWSGKECLATRVNQLSKAWFMLVPHVHVYTDFADEDVLENITKSNPHVNITFHLTQLRGEYLIGSAFETPYNLAQSRHILSMADIYQLYPNKKWYFFCDDDCYLEPSKVLRMCQTVYGTQFGMSYYFIEETYKFFPGTNPTRTFHHGGPGIAVTHQLMEKAGPRLMECDSIYRASKLGSDIRLSACYGRIFGLREWYYRGFEANTYGFFNSNTPDHNIFWESEMNERILSYHLIQQNDTIKIWKSHVSMWKDSKNQTLHTDWSNIMLQNMPLDIGAQGNTFLFIFWYALRLNKVNYYPVSNPQPIFKDNDSRRTDPIGYEQEYENGIKILLLCDNERADEPVQSGFLPPPNTGATISYKCPRPAPLINNNENPQVDKVIIPVDHH